MSETNRPLILISNDDGYQAPGVHRLIDFLTPFADIVAVCPDGPRSGQSSAITVNQFLRIEPLPDYNGAKMFKTTGTPVDCVKLAMYAALDRKPDMVLAGINHGSNASINVNYSGTMGAVFEGCAFGIPSIGFSLTDHRMDANFEPCRPFVVELVKATLANGLPDGVCLNVNFPNDCVPTEMRFVREARGCWTEEYAKYVDPHGRDCYFLTGSFRNDEPNAEDTDEYCLKHGIVSVVPVDLWRYSRSSSLDWLKNLCKSTD